MSSDPCSSTVSNLVWREKKNSVNIVPMVKTWNARATNRRLRPSLSRYVMNRQMGCGGGQQYSQSTTVQWMKRRLIVGCKASSLANSRINVLMCRNELEEDVPPFCSFFSRYALGGHALCISDEDGWVEILDSRLPLDIIENAERKRHRWLAHANAVFDLKWTDYDTKIITASGDQTARLFDIETRKLLLTFESHNGSVKSISTHPLNPHVYATGARDGHLMLWDSRISMKIAGSNKRRDQYNAHTLQMFKRKRSQGSIPVDSCAAVTTVNLMKDGFSLITGGAASGCMKAWDLRRLKGRKNKQIQHVDEFCPRRSPGRPYGISSIDVDESGTTLLVNFTNNIINLFHFGMSNPCFKSYNTRMSDSFYVKACFSPDGRHILAGSCDSKAYIWPVLSCGSSYDFDGISSFAPDEVSIPKDVILERRRQQKYSSEEIHNVKPIRILSDALSEVTCVDWCKIDPQRIVTCSDDSIVRCYQLPNACDEEKTYFSNPYLVYKTILPESQKNIQNNNNSQTNTQNKPKKIQYTLANKSIRYSTIKNNMISESMETSAGRSVKDKIKYSENIEKNKSFLWPNKEVNLKQKKEARLIAIMRAKIKAEKIKENKRIKDEENKLHNGNGETDKTDILSKISPLSRYFRIKPRTISKLTDTDKMYHSMMILAQKSKVRQVLIILIVITKHVL
eukprot:GSMAST32.ASY1.ANO1.1213.1 assembled CDS